MASSHPLPSAALIMYSRNSSLLATQTSRRDLERPAHGHTRDDVDHAYVCVVDLPFWFRPSVRFATSDIMALWIRFERVGAEGIEAAAVSLESLRVSEYQANA